MRVIIQRSAAEATQLAADLLEDRIRRKPDLVVALPTGNTPVRLYRELVRRHRERRLDFAHATTFNLDEFIGLGDSHPGSFAHYMHEHLFRHVDLDRTRCHVPRAGRADAADVARAYEAEIRAAGGLDLVLLGIGADGHIAFNEPGSSLGSRTRVKSLSRRTRTDHAAVFGGEAEVPREVITMGVQTIMDGREIVLLASGASKAEIVARALEGPVTAMVPASVLQFHPLVTAILDDAAAERLALKDEYREAAGR